MSAVRFCLLAPLTSWKCEVRELAQMDRALGLGPRGREFESRIPDVIVRSVYILLIFELVGLDMGGCGFEKRLIA